MAVKCPECGLEMLIYSAAVNADGGSETAYVCRNPKCARYDRRLKKKKDAPAADAAEEA